ncbi:MAG: hypothetical protein KAW12_27670 [Candidatus Aminicenantes bacterium]|nr:hypothetical protein [Candidatus Aminicenantes bacterium]
MKLKKPFGYTIGAAFIFLIILLALAEIAARSDSVRSALPAPSMGGAIKSFGMKFAYLDRLVEKKGRVDCIVIGSSMILLGIDPPAFSRAYKARTGREMICFNFGLGGFLPPGTAIAAKILVEKYKPKLLLWGINPISFRAKFKQGPVDFLEKIPWVRYRRGDFNFEGWLTDLSYAYRYFLRFRVWSEQPEYSRGITKAESFISKYGRKVKKTNKLIPLKPKPGKLKRFRRNLTDSRGAKKALTAFKKVLKLRSQTQVVIFEIPVHRSVLPLYRDGAEGHYRVVSYIKKQANRRGIMFFPTMHLDLIPDEGWSNLNHMNNYGALVFSTWLGEQIAQAVKKGLIKIGID